jgi:hypothetical protein
MMPSATDCAQHLIGQNVSPILRDHPDLGRVGKIIRAFQYDGSLWVVIEFPDGQKLSSIASQWRTA